MAMPHTACEQNSMRTYGTCLTHRFRDLVCTLPDVSLQLFVTQQRCSGVQQTTEYHVDRAETLLKRPASAISYPLSLLLRRSWQTVPARCEASAAAVAVVEEEAVGFAVAEWLH